ncbi:uncharacterized protein AMSG_02816 [Thecamonas trahens ATCC 50062]|uniref:PLOD1-3-like GT domain-containing protein n=1 Tax=Thecamonas trahens ATCC 50062 TaxID=461836 RepID=A0A0L0D1Y4_THETB|nr:hypothetical protein AMSG_02816 [Thecamonas trahens ATCC 50062]KNC46364.1 hypothetical protein AMSG_02816 [Thecamonas trahens ATCC 50062]|eukprot:XP_013760657.1 hypothetical protein AMSG_02816 [Thecamonas trahens ATCC 50062]
MRGARSRKLGDDGAEPGPGVPSDSEIAARGVADDDNVAVGGDELPGSIAGGDAGGGDNNDESGEAKFHYFTYATHRGSDDLFCKALSSAWHARVPLQILGWGTRWTGLADKLKGVQLALEALPPHDIFVFVDAYDVLFVENVDVLQEAYVAAMAQYAREADLGDVVLFAGERGCWPYMDGRPEGKELCEVVYPTSPTPYRYVNSGMWAGTVRSAQRLMALVADVLAAAPDGANDQEIISDLYLARIPGVTDSPIVLDTATWLFMCLHLSQTDLHNDLTNKLTGHKPAILHFNGGSKPSMRSIASALPTPRSEAPEFDLASIAADGGLELTRASLADLCRP